jgi:hypothetical protein
MEDRDSGAPTPQEAAEGETPLKAEEQEEAAGLFPPDIAPPVEIGGTPEEQETLREEMNR